MLFNLNLKHIVNFLNLYEDLKKEKLPFKLSLILAKNNQIIEKEYDFYLEQRDQLMDKYFVLDEASGAYITLNKEKTIFKIKDGLDQECHDAFKELEEFEVQVDLRTIPSSMLENLNFTLEHVEALSMLLEEEEEIKTVDIVLD